MAAGNSRARFAGTLGMGALALAAFVVVPARAAAQQGAPKATPSKAGAVMPGMSDAQLCSMLKGTLKNMGGGKGKAAANRKAYEKIDVATPDRALQGRTPTNRSSAKGAAQGDTVSSEVALLGHMPPAGAAPQSAAPQGGVQIGVSTGPGQPVRTITCKQ